MSAVRELVLILTENPLGTLQLAVLTAAGIIAYRTLLDIVAGWIDGLEQARARDHEDKRRGVAFRRDFTFGRDHHSTDIRSKMRRLRRHNLGRKEPIMDLDEAVEHIGRRVTYRTRGNRGTGEDGVITAVGPRYVMVRYDGDGQSKATTPDCLTLEDA